MGRRLEACSRLVIKIGSALLVDDHGELRHKWLGSLCQDIVGLRERGIEVVVVSSGAIALGRSAIGLQRGNDTLNELQAAAAIGQIELAGAWLAEFAPYKQPAAQVLLTLDDTEERKRYLNALDTLRTLLRHKVVPIINENDTVATDEIRYGDNDRLAARVAQMIEADHLILLSNVDGLFTDLPGRPDARHIDFVETISPEIESMASTITSSTGTGGMASKIDAARIAVAAGCQVFICNGLTEHALSKFCDGGPATQFAARERQGQARKRWIGAALKPTGRLWLDKGAVSALGNGKSLLAVGVTKADGDFERGDSLLLLDDNDHEIGRGLSAYSAQDVQSLLSADSPTRPRGAALVHRNDLALANSSGPQDGNSQ